MTDQPNAEDERQRRINQGRVFGEFLADERYQLMAQMFFEELFIEWTKAQKSEQARELYLLSRGFQAFQQRLLTIRDEGRMLEAEAQRQHNIDTQGHGAAPMTGVQVRARHQKG